MSVLIIGSGWVWGKEGSLRYQMVVYMWVRTKSIWNFASVFSLEFSALAERPYYSTWMELNDAISYEQDKQYGM